MASAGASAAKETWDKKVVEMVDELDRSRMRKIQLEMLKCAASCSENQEASREQNQRCVEKCSSAINTAQNHVQREMWKLKERVRKCLLDCKAKAKREDRAGPNSSVEEFEGATPLYGVCCTQCFDNQTKLLPELLQRMKKEL